MLNIFNLSASVKWLSFWSYLVASLSVSCFVNFVDANHKYMRGLWFKHTKSLSFHRSHAYISCQRLFCWSEKYVKSFIMDINTQYIDVLYHQIDDDFVLSIHMQANLLDLPSRQIFYCILMQLRKPAFTAFLYLKKIWIFFFSTEFFVLWASMNVW